ncbi:MAG: response regulator [Patescibacteria group bacterium]|nr:response regulator [Patescibacteria group bacterium]
MNQTQVLLIEEDDFLARIYAQKLESEGFDVTAAMSGEEGIRLALRQPPACILLSIMLPGMDGYETLETIKAEPTLAQVPVIIVSQLGQREDIEKAKSLGVAGYLIKAHASPMDVVKKVREVINN